MFKIKRFYCTVDPVYSLLDYSERVSPHRSLINSETKYVSSEYPGLVDTFAVDYKGDRL